MNLFNHHVVQSNFNHQIQLSKFDCIDTMIIEDLNSKLMFVEWKTKA